MGWVLTVLQHNPTCHLVGVTLAILPYSRCFFSSFPCPTNGAVLELEVWTGWTSSHRGIDCCISAGSAGHCVHTPNPWHMQVSSSEPTGQNHTKLAEVTSFARPKQMHMDCEADVQ